jgi:rhamnose transport system permease protein
MNAPVLKASPVARLRQAGGASALRLRFLGVVLFVLLLGVLFTVLTPSFLTVSNGRSILFSASVLAIAAAGQTLVVLTGNLDLSVGSIMGVSAYVVYDLAGDLPVLKPWVVLLAVVLGVLLGAVNGVLVAVLEIPSIVATLGTLAVYRGFVSVYANAREVSVGQLPGWIRRLTTAVWGSVPAAVWLALLVVVVVALALQFAPWGRRIYAYGSNPKAARFFGLDSRTIVLGAYVGAGVIAALAGLVVGAQVGNINSLLANGIELQVLAAVVVGGVSIWGGSGSVFGAALGAIVLAMINNGLVLLDVSEYYRLLFQGLAIILAVGVDAIVQNRVRTATRRRRILEVSA